MRRIQFINSLSLFMPVTLLPCRSASEGPFDLYPWKEVSFVPSVTPDAWPPSAGLFDLKILFNVEILKEHQEKHCRHWSFVSLWSGTNKIYEMGACQNLIQVQGVHWILCVVLILRPICTLAVVCCVQTRTSRANAAYSQASTYVH